MGKKNSYPHFLARGSILVKFNFQETPVQFILCPVKQDASKNIIYLPIHTQKKKKPSLPQDNALMGSNNKSLYTTL